MTVLDHVVDRTIVIRARPAAVFRHFTDTARWAAWWGAGSSIDPRPGGAVRIRYPDGTEALGEVVDITVPTRIVFTYGYATGAPIPAGGSRVTIRLEPHPDGTRVVLMHAFADASQREAHVQGWRYQLSLFSNVVLEEVNAGAASAVDSWFAAWAVLDANARHATLAGIAAPDVEFRDRYSAVSGVADLVAHIGGVQRFMPGLRLRRDGDVRHCQGMLLAHWTAEASDGTPRGAGTNVFVFDADARMTTVVGFWN
jgi:uncharacterized protein YndB with AHSA1/START domain